MIDFIHLLPNNLIHLDSLYALCYSFFQVIRNVTSSKPTFYVKNLKPGTRFEARVYTSNQKGRSDEVFVMRASTLKRASDKRPVTSLASGAGKFFDLYHS